MVIVKREGFPDTVFRIWRPAWWRLRLTETAESHMVTTCFAGPRPHYKMPGSPGREPLSSAHIEGAGSQGVRTNAAVAILHPGF